MRFALTLLSVLLLLALAACAQVEETPAPVDTVDVDVTTDDVNEDEMDTGLAAWAEGNNRFGGEMYEKLAHAHPGENVCYSPISAYLAFGMLYPGAVGEAKTEMADVLHFTLPESMVNKSSYAMLQRYQTSDEKTGVIELANSAWYQQDYPIENDYIDLVKRYYRAAFEPCDFESDAEAERKRINKWCAEKTHDRITDPIPEGDLDSSSRLVLVNATYLKQFWQSAFEPAMTTDEPFHRAGEQLIVPTMHAERNVFYHEDTDFQAISLPYKDERFAMMFVLPRKGVGLDTVAGMFIEHGLSSFMPEKPIREMTKIALPKFEFENNYNLTEPLKELGLRRAFAPGGAFRKICKSDDLLCVDLVLQSTFIKVDEEGTEAATVTVISMKTMAMPPQSAKVFKADHPFLFFLYDTKTDAVLFMGRVMDPSKK